MKNKIFISLLIVTFCGMINITASAEDKNEIVLNDGRVLKNPYIISRTPAGLNVGHENGVIFVPFSKMSKERQKKYDYKPKESKKYKKKIAKAQYTRQVRIAKEKAKKTDTGSYYGHERFPEKSAKSALQDELASLLREKSRLERERSRVSSGRISPRSGSSSDHYISYRGGKVYRKKQTSYGQQTTKNVNEKRRRIKEINSALQKNIRRTTTVRNLISRAKTKGIQKGRTVNY